MKKGFIDDVSQFNEFEKISLKHTFELLLTLLKQLKCSVAVLGSWMAFFHGATNTSKPLEFFKTLTLLSFAFGLV